MQRVQILESLSGKRSSNSRRSTMHIVYECVPVQYPLECEEIPLNVGATEVKEAAGGL